jgi:hypothetical protein
MGTLDHLRHLVLANARYYNGSTLEGGEHAVQVSTAQPFIPGFLTYSVAVFLK